MKRFVKLMLALIIAFSGSIVAVGCNRHDPHRITIGMWPDAVNVEEVAMFEEWRRAFNEVYPHVTVVPSPYTYSPDTFIPMAMAGTTPTIFQTWFTEPGWLIADGFVKDLTFIYEENGWSDYLIPGVKSLLSNDEGRIFGVPRDAYGLGLFMNLDHLALAGLTEYKAIPGFIDEARVPIVPTTLYNPQDPNDLTTLTGMAIAVREALAEADRHIEGSLLIYASGRNGGWQFSNFAWNFGARLQVFENGRWRANLNSTEAVNTLDWIRRLVHVYQIVNPRLNNLNYGDFPEMFGFERMSMAIGGSDAADRLVGGVTIDPSNIAFVPIPAGPGGQYALFGGTPFMVSSSACDTQARYAIRFLEFMGRAPGNLEVAEQGFRQVYTSHQNMGVPILPVMSVWDHAGYNAMLDNLFDEFRNDADFARFRTFFDAIDERPEMLRQEEPFFAQDMYAILDLVIRDVFDNPNWTRANLQERLDRANNDFQTRFMNQL